MFQRASRSLPSCVARSMFAADFARPSSAIASAGGFTSGDRKVSMQWAIASIPVAAVSIGGRPTVRSGSQIATFGSSHGDRKPSLRPSFSTITEPRPTSLPVPAVVGIAISGATADVMRGPPPSTAAYCTSGPACVASSATALPRSSDDPPPIAMIPSAFAAR